MTHLPRNCVALTVLAAATALGAHAADSDSSWALGEKDGKSFLHMTDASGPSLTLNCHDRMGLQAVLYLNGAEIDDLALNSTTRLSTRNVDMDTATTESRDGEWVYLRRAKVLISSKGWQAKRIYNAAVTGSAVSFDVSRVGEYSVTPAPINDSFKSFVASCDSV